MPHRPYYILISYKIWRVMLLSKFICLYIIFRLSIERVLSLCWLRTLAVFYKYIFFSTTKLDVTHRPLKDLQNLMFSRYLLIINLLFYVIKQKKTASTNFSRVYSTWSQNKIRHINFYYFTPFYQQFYLLHFFNKNFRRLLFF